MQKLFCKNLKALNLSRSKKINNINILKDCKIIIYHFYKGSYLIFFVLLY